MVGVARVGIGIFYNKDSRYRFTQHSRQISFLAFPSPGSLPILLYPSSRLRNPAIIYKKVSSKLCSLAGTEEDWSVSARRPESGCGPVA